MASRSNKPHRKTFNHPGKISATIAFVTVSIMGIIGETPQTSLRNAENPQQTGELSLIQAGKVIISRYEMTDPTTGEKIFVSKIKNR